MTAAPETMTVLPRGAYVSGGARALRHWERALIVLAVCLPVPVLAATGLSIPLPSTVERLAAALVPWADTASFEENEAAAGSPAPSTRRPVMNSFQRLATIAKRKPSALSRPS